ncbi:MAG: sulfite exporter TauE/SafE family protein [Ignavibacteriae bacterium]|nr:sulfite exporter TauE/SafE family protein [Ignavibacteriota bacterium]
MELSFSTTLLVCSVFFVVAGLYSSVGHGGASGYLAVLSLFAVAQKEMSTTALILNIVVASIAFVFYVRAGHFSWNLTFPFLFSSIPLAFVGGLVDVSTQSYAILLAAALLFASYRLIIHIEAKEKTFQTSPSMMITLLAGAVIGLVSGIVGVGGGIFLSPLILLMGWATAKQTSATSAFFIVVNSIAGLLGRQLEGNFVVGNFLPFLFAAILGGVVGSQLGATIFSSLWLRRILGFVLIIAAFKLILISF